MVIKFYYIVSINQNNINEAYLSTKSYLIVWIGHPLIHYQNTKNKFYTKSSKTDILHHLIILMLQNMTMPDIATASDFETKWLSIVMTDFHTKNSYFFRVSIDHISEYFLMLFWELVLSDSERLRIKIYRHERVPI